MFIPGYQWVEIEENCVESKAYTKRKFYKPRKSVGETGKGIINESKADITPSSKRF